MQKWQHCKLEDNRVTFLGARGVFENKADSHGTQRGAWSALENEGWELVSAVMDAEGQPIFFFKRLEVPEA